MKVLLVQPPIQDFYETDLRLQPIGLCYLKAAARRYHPDVEVQVLDAHQGHGRRTISVPQELEYLKRYYGFRDRTPFSTFHNYYHFGMDFEELVERVLVARPDVIGISALFSPYFREVVKIASLVKKVLPQCDVLLGGSHVSAMKGEILELYNDVDYIIVGEGERAFCEFLSFKKGLCSIESVSGLGYRSQGRVHLNEVQPTYDLDEMEMPDFSDLNLSDYRVGTKPMSFLISSRSCPHKCSFCSVHLTFGNRYRRRTVQSILDEIGLRYRQGVRVVDFEDDNLTFYKDEMKELLRALAAKHLGGEMQFVAMNGISYLSLDLEMLELMKAANFTHLNVALVSSDDLVLEATKRPHTTKKYVEIVNHAHHLGLKIVSYQILGLPFEDLESMAQTMAFQARLPVLLGASPFYLTPNSPISKKFPKLTEKDIFLSRLTAMAWESEHFKRDDIYTLFVTVRILNFLKELSLAEDQDLDGAFAHQKEFGDQRVRLGMEILEKLLLTGKLWRVHSTERKIDEAFQMGLFQNVWQRTKFVMTKNSRHLIL